MTQNTILTTSSKKSPIVRFLVSIIILCMLLWYLLPASLFSGISIQQWTINIVNTVQFHEGGPHNIINTLLLFGFLALATSCALPRQIAALVAGINLGALMGAVVATLAVTLGCWVTFTVSRYLFSERVRAKHPDQINSLSAFINEKTFLKVIVIRLLPIGSNFLTNIVAGVSKVSMKTYVSASFVGFIPQMVIFSLAGSGIRLGAKNEIIASAVLFGIALLLTAYLVKVHKQKKPPTIDEY